MHDPSIVDDSGPPSGIGELPWHRHVVPTDMLGSEVGATFDAHPELPGLLVSEGDDCPPSLLSRAFFHEQLAGNFAWEVYSRRPIGVLIRNAAPVALEVTVDGSIEEAACLALGRDERFARDPVLYRAVDGSWRMVDVRTLLRAQGELLRHALTQAEEGRRRAEAAMHWKTRFLAKVSHEIRTPLHGILNMIDLLDAEGGTEELENSLVTIADCGRRLGRLLDDILDHTKLESGKLSLNNSVWDLARTLESTAESMAGLAGEKALVIDCVLDPDLPRLVEGDRTRIEQVLINLLGNAVKFTPSGRIRLQVRPAAPTQLEFVIEDSGPGIPEGLQETIFEEFAQGDTVTDMAIAGTGLGLTLVRQIVGLMGGTIDVTDSEDLGGACFRFDAHLPDAGNEQAMARPTDRGRVWIATGEPDRDAGIAAWLDRRGWKRTLKLEEASRAIVSSSNLREASGVAGGVCLVPFGCRRDAALPRGWEWGSVPLRHESVLEALESNALEPGSGSSAGQEAKKSSPELQLPPLRVLIVDDNAVNLMVLQQHLERRGHEVTRAVDGEKAAAIHASASPDLILMDCNMPVLDGWEATRKIRNHEAMTGRGRTPVVALTASPLEEIREACVACGMDDALGKPFSAEDLDQMLVRVARASVLDDPAR